MYQESLKLLIREVTERIEGLSEEIVEILYKKGWMLELLNLPLEDLKAINRDSLRALYRQLPRNTVADSFVTFVEQRAPDVLMVDPTWRAIIDANEPVGVVELTRYVLPTGSTWREVISELFFTGADYAGLMHREALRAEKKNSIPDSWKETLLFVGSRLEDEDGNIWIPVIEPLYNSEESYTMYTVELDQEICDGPVAIMEVQLL